MARKSKDGAPKKEGTLRRMRTAYVMTKKSDPKVGLVTGAWFLGVGIVVAFLVGLISNFIIGAAAGIVAGALAWVIVFGRRAERAAFAQVEGQAGAAGAALGILRRGWQVQQAITVTKNQELVHRVIGRPGVILVGEGNPSRVRNLLAVEKKKHARVVGEIPIYDFAVTDHGDDGTVAVRDVAKRIQKLPRNIAPSDITDVMQRLRALDAMRPQIPVPKGPMPTSAKQARAAIRGTRGPR